MRSQSDQSIVTSFCVISRTTPLPSPPIKVLSSPSCTQYFLPHLIIRNSCRIRWLSAFNLLSLEEGDIEDWRKEIHKLKHEYFERQVVLIFRLCPMHFCNKSNFILKIRAIKVTPFVQVEAPLSCIWSVHLAMTLINRWLRFLWYPLNRGTWRRSFLWYRQAVIETINVMYELTKRTQEILFADWAQ